MIAPLLTTKLYIPPTRPELVPRPRLIKRLTAGLNGKLTLVSAPAGFGKTTLLSEWAGCCGRPVAWLSLDESDNDPVRFLAYFVAALQTIGANIGDGMIEALQAPHPPPLEEMLTTLINQINTIPGTEGSPGRSFILVLDDYHFIAAQPIHDALAFLLDHLPGNMHLAIATRSDPSLPIARLRGRGQLTELRLTELRFTAEEAAAFLNQAMNLNLAADDLAALASRTEGWITGLQMAAVSMRDREDIPTFVQAFAGSNRYILDYLVEEVLQRQPNGIQTFLLQTAILDRLTGSLCDAVIGAGRKANDGNISSIGFYTPPSSRQALEHLERANLFVMPLDDQREWYRYHRLFADLLRRRLRETEPGLVPMLHRRASEWYERNGLVAEAIEHALSARDFERATHLIEQVAEATLMRSEVATFLSWMEALPDELVRARPTLCVFHAWALLLAGHPLDDIESRLQNVDGDADLVLSKVAPFWALVAAFRGQMSRAAELSRQALERLSEDDSFLLGIAALTLGLSQVVSGDMATGSRALEEVARMSQQAGNVMLAVMTLCNLAEVHIAQGQLTEARDIYQRALQMSAGRRDRQGRPLPIAGMPLMGLGELAREWNDLDAATRYLTEGIERIEQWGEIGALDGLISLARARQAQGDVDGAREAIQKVRQLAVKFDATDLDDFLVAVHQVRLWVAQGNLEAAVSWVERRGFAPGPAEALAERAFSTDLEDDDSHLDYHLRQREQITVARVLIAQDRPAEALALLEPLLATMEQRGRYTHRRAIELYLLRALAFQARGNVAQALIALERALSLAEPGGYVRIFVDEGLPMASLLYEAAARGIAPDHAGRLLAAFANETKGERSTPRTGDLPVAVRPPSLVEPLSERELEVLGLIAEGLTNQQVAHRLFITLRTVKWHTSNIYGKLGVKNRTQAVAKARALGILPVT